MRKKLFEEVFKKAEERSPSKTRNGVCAFLENAFSEMDRYHPNKETFVRYYKKYKEGKNIKYNPNADLLNRCAQYLGYEDYEDFVLKNPDSSGDVISENPENFGSGKGVESEEGNFVTWIKKNKKLVVVNVVVLIVIIITISTDILSMNGDRWMTWDENKYVEVTFNLKDYYNDALVPYDQNKIDLFKEIEKPDCETDYLNNKGEAKLWYYKVGKGNLELYTGPGLHPTNGKTLRPITRYMIREHICPDF